MPVKLVAVSGSGLFLETCGYFQETSCAYLDRKTVFFLKKRTEKSQMKELSCCDYFCEFNERTEMFDSEVKKKER